MIAPLCPECGRPLVLLDQDDGDPADVYRWTCEACDVAYPPDTFPVPPLGAVGDEEVQS